MDALYILVVSNEVVLPLIGELSRRFGPSGTRGRTRMLAPCTTIYGGFIVSRSMSSFHLRRLHNIIVAIETS